MEQQEHHISKPLVKYTIKDSAFAQELIEHIQ
jgi:hypothetical protein